MLLAALLVLGQVPVLNPRGEGPIYNDGTSQQLAVFEFAPASGAGMGSACACSAVTGAKGEAVTFARASSATCIKSNSASSIANGDLVSCGSGLPRVMPGFDGTTVNGIAIDKATTNVCTQSQAINNAAFSDFTGTGGSAPTLNGADAAAGPWGTTTAEGYTFAATTGAQASMRSFAGATAAAYSCGVFVKGQSGSGTMDVCIETGAGPTATCAACAYTNTAYNWCQVLNVTSIASGRCFIGNGSALNGGTARSSNAVYVEQVDLQAQAWLAQPIPTAGASATANAESASVAITSTTFAQGSLAFSEVTTAPNVANAGWVVLAGPLVSNFRDGFIGFGAANGGSLYANATQQFANAVSPTLPGNHRLAGYWGAGGIGYFVDGVGSTGAGVADTVAVQWVNLGDYQGGTAVTMPAVYKRVCVDPDPTRCR